MSERRKWVEIGLGGSVRKQCSLLGLSRSSYYYKPIEESPLNLELMRLIDQKFLEVPYYGRSKYTEWLRREGHKVNHKRVGRLLKVLGIAAITPGPSTTVPNRTHRVYPYLLKEMEIERCNQVWAADITWIPTAEGYLYLVAIIDWYSRYIISWALSDTLQTDFCTQALEEAFEHGRPEIFNTDQGVQFTSSDFIDLLQCRDIQISMDGKGCYWDNIIVERLWRTIKYEEVYIKRYETGEEAFEGLAEYIAFYNRGRIHQALDYKTPAEVYFRGIA